jgi:hypothetical protein
MNAIVLPARDQLAAMRVPVVPVALLLPTAMSTAGKSLSI